MLNKLAISILILFLSCSFAASRCKAALSPLAGKVIIINPGHGGNGAIANGVREANVNLAVGLIPGGLSITSSRVYRMVL